MQFLAAGGVPPIPANLGLLIPRDILNNMGSPFQLLKAYPMIHLGMKRTVWPWLAFSLSHGHCSARTRARRGLFIEQAKHVQNEISLKGAHVIL